VIEKTDLLMLAVYAVAPDGTILDREATVVVEAAIV
jgi:hypothetical protein